jgi:transposase-like protein
MYAARAEHGVNANQVFGWRRAFERGELAESCALLPVTVSSSGEPASDIPEQAAAGRSSRGGSIHIEFPGRVMISVEHGADRRSVNHMNVMKLAPGVCLFPCPHRCKPTRICRGWEDKTLTEVRAVFDLFLSGKSCICLGYQ